MLGSLALLGGLAVSAPPAQAHEGRTRVQAAIDWRMPDLTVDADENGVIDSYLEGNRTADVPTDGRYDVVLDGCDSTGATSYTWRVGAERITSAQCSTTTRLTEGKHAVTLTARGPRGTDSAHRTITVKTTIVLGLGDSYSAGSGAQVLGDNPAAGGYYDANCGRTPRSHQALAALAQEQADPRSSVILIHLSCGGAQISPGLLTPFRGTRPQVDQARDLLHGQRIDELLLSIGGNDVGFGSMIGYCLLSAAPDCPLAPVAPGVTFHDWLMQQFDFLRNGGDPAEPISGLPLLAECLGGGGCTTSETPDGTGEALDVSPRDVLFTTYPDLTRADDGAYCDVVPGATDPGLVNAAEREWAWLDGVVQAVHQKRAYTYTDSTGAAHRLAQSSPGLNATIAETRKRYGWTPVTGVYTKAFTRSSGHGYCAGTFDPADGSGRWTFRILPSEEPSVIPASLLVPVHPNAGGHAHYTRQILSAVDSHGHRWHR